jgi:signal transduction histidine kinase
VCIYARDKDGRKKGDCNSSALHNLAETNLASTGINVSTEFEGMDRRFPAETELALFRIAQEAIGNIVRHSEAKNAAIELECDADKCVLRVEDDGKGFDVSEIRGIDGSGRGAGLFGLEEGVTWQMVTELLNLSLDKGPELLLRF